MTRTAFNLPIQGDRHQRYARQAGACVVCARVATRRVGTKGYCSLHISDAATHQRRLQVEQDRLNRRGLSRELGSWLDDPVDSDAD